MARRIAIGIALTLLAPGPAHAQDANPIPAGSVFERQVRERWLHGRHHPAFTRFVASQHWIRVDSLESGRGDGERTFHLRIGPGSGYAGLLTMDAAGHVTRAEARPLPQPEIPYIAPIDSARHERLRYFEGRAGSGVLSLPETKVWDLVPAVDPARAERFEPGARWTDTLDLAAERGGYRQALSGTRVSTITGDTVIAGHRQWVVRDSARVRYAERWLARERTLDTLVVVEREGDGTIRGRYLYDPELRLYSVRNDTTAIAGIAVLRFPDGRAFRTPARFERTRRINLHDAAAYEARREARRAASIAERGGMLFLPKNELEKRLAAGDTAVRDSLLTEWRRSADADERERILLSIQRWHPPTPASRERLREILLELGDTVRTVAEWRDRFRQAGRRGDAETLRRLLPFMADPGLAFAFGMARDPFYENVRDGLLRRPPVILADPESWPCTPEACRMLAQQWETADEPRLRDLGLIAHLVLDPARWADSVIARAEDGSALVRPALMLIRGVGATWPAASKAPLPGPDADWRAWVEWMNGRDPDFPSPPVPLHAREDRIRFGSSHATAIRFYQARTGRDVIAELRRKQQAATVDSARLVYGAMLLGLGERAPDPTPVAARLHSGSDADRALGLRELRRLFDHSATPADSATAARLVHRLLAVVIQGADPWPELNPSPDRRGFGLRRIAGTQEPPAPVLILSDSVPPAVREQWRDRATLVSRAEWEARSARLPAILFKPSTVARVGPFVRLGVDYTALRTRAENERPSGYAGGITVYLIETETGWVVVDLGMWIT